MPNESRAMDESDPEAQGLGCRAERWSMSMVPDKHRCRRITACIAKSIEGLKRTMVVRRTKGTTVSTLSNKDAADTPSRH